MKIVEALARRPYTVAEIRSLVDAGIVAEDEKFELIDGQVIPKPPNGNHHEIVKSALGTTFAKRTRDDLRVAVATSVYLDEYTFVEPDICLYPKRILPEAVTGEDVLLAIEVATSSLAYDRGLKASIYSRHGVQELWVVNATTRETWVHRKPASDGNWSSIERVAADMSLAPAALPDLKIIMAGLQ